MARWLWAAPRRGEGLGGPEGLFALALPGGVRSQKVERNWGAAHEVDKQAEDDAFSPKLSLLCPLQSPKCGFRNREAGRNLTKSKCSLVTPPSLIETE